MFSIGARYFHQRHAWLLWLADLMASDSDGLRTLAQITRFKQQEVRKLAAFVAKKR